MATSPPCGPATGRDGFKRQSKIRRLTDSKNAQVFLAIVPEGLQVLTALSQPIAVIV
jgi:hypothetical protein